MGLRKACFGARRPFLRSLWAPRLLFVELRDSDVVLRDWRLDDVDAVAAACSDPEIPRWIPWVPVPYTREHAEAYVRACLDGGDERYAFAIAGAGGGEVLGSIDLRLNAHGYRGHVGYWVAAQARGHGVCTRALRVLSRWALEELELQRMELITDPANLASQRVAEKVGYRREGVLRAHLRHPDGRIRDSVMFSLLPGELKSAAAAGRPDRGRFGRRRAREAG